MWGPCLWNRKLYLSLICLLPFHHLPRDMRLEKMCVPDRMFFMFLWISNMAEFEPVAKSITMRVMATWDHRFCSRCRSSHFEGLSTRSCWKRHKLIKSYFRRSISRIDAREFGVKEMEIPEKDRLRPFCWFCELGKYDASHASLEHYIRLLWNFPFKLVQ